MRRWAVVLSALSVSLGAATAVAGTASADNDTDPYTLSNGHAQAGPMAGLVHAKDARPGGPKQSPNLTYHGGRVQTAPTAVHAIFWGTSWGDSNFVGDKTSGLAALYGGLSNSAYASTNTEYTNANPSTHVNSNVASYDVQTDLSAGPTRAPSTSTVLAEVAKYYPNPTANAYYPVYIDGKRGNAGYCAWHSSGTINGVQVQFGFFFNLDGDAGCDPVSPTSFGHSQGLAALANVTGHEFSEMVTDPQIDGWLDAQGSENADKCAWTFNGAENLGGTSWLIQGNWSNAAYTGNHGYISAGTKYRGCINGNTLQF